MSIVLTLDKVAPEGVDATVIGVFADDLDNHAKAAFFSVTGWKAALGKKRYLDGEDGLTIAVGLGNRAELTVDSFRTLGAAIARTCAKQTAVATTILDDVGELDKASCANALAEGAVLGGYEYLALRSQPEPSTLTSITVVGAGGKRVQAALETGAGVATAVCEARDLVNEPGGTLTPVAFAKQTVALGKKYGFAVEVLDKKAIVAAKMGGLLGVNRGSEQQPRFLELTWIPEGKARGAVAMVGKGVTFDSGGLSLKPSDGMLSMKSDMGGAAAVVGAFCALATTMPKVEVRGYLPLTDNMTGGDATRLGDVLTISNGKTVEIHNTDAEGRLILADGLSRASLAEPDAMVDVATLTGACMVALGSDIAGVFSTHDDWRDQILAASAAVDEPTWHLPMPKDMRKQLDSKVADMKNIGTRMGGASTAAIFLAEFVGEDIPWAHIDIAGPGFRDDANATSPAGGTGFGVRTLVQLLGSFKKPR